MAGIGAGAGSVRVLYFAWLRERVGAAEENITLAAPEITVAGLVAQLAGRSPGHVAAFADRRVVRCAVNQEFATQDAIVRAGDEVAFFPPVTGG